MCSPIQYSLQCWSWSLKRDFLAEFSWDYEVETWSKFGNFMFGRDFEAEGWSWLVVETQLFLWKHWSVGSVVCLWQCFEYTCVVVVRSKTASNSNWPFCFAEWVGIPKKSWPGLTNISWLQFGVQSVLSCLLDTIGHWWTKHILEPAVSTKAAALLPLCRHQASVTTQISVRACKL